MTDIYDKAGAALSENGSLLKFQNYCKKEKGIHWTI
jgi:hypothetical protein